LQEWDFSGNDYGTKPQAHSTQEELLDRSLRLPLSLTHTLCCTLMTSLPWVSIRNILGLIDLILGILSLFEVRNRKFCIG
jgi:hypothetical protein